MLMRGLAATVAWLAISSAAAAAPAARVRLVLERGAGTESCPDEDHLRAAIVERLGYDPFDPSVARPEALEIRCAIRSDGRWLRARLQLSSSASSGASTPPVAERQIASHGTDCGELKEAIEIAVSIAIGPRPLPELAPAPFGETPPGETRPSEAPPTDTRSREAPPAAAAAALPVAPKPPSTGGAAAVATVATATASHAIPPAHRSDFFELGAGAGVTAGLAPGIAPGVDLSFAWGRRDRSLAIEARLVAPSSAELGGGMVKASLWTASLVPCLRRSAFAMCGVATGGVLRAHAEGIVLASSTQTPVADLGARAGVRYPIGDHLAVTATAEVAAALVISHLTIDGMDAWVSPRLSTAGALGLVGIFR